MFVCWLIFTKLDSFCTYYYVMCFQNNILLECPSCKRNDLVVAQHSETLMPVLMSHFPQWIFPYLTSPLWCIVHIACHGFCSITPCCRELGKAGSDNWIAVLGKLSLVKHAGPSGFVSVEFVWPCKLPRSWLFVFPTWVSTVPLLHFRPFSSLQPLVLREALVVRGGGIVRTHGCPRRSWFQPWQCHSLAE